MKIAIASDHGGFELKEELKQHYTGLNFNDLGTYSTESVDYPDIADKMAQEILTKKADLGILICGTGIGISIAANKIKGIRAALCADWYSAKSTRLHNDANVICMGGRTTGAGSATEMLDVFLHTDFEGGKHALRVDKIKKLED